MSSRGYYRMARGWMEHEAFAREPFTQREAWLWMIERAAWRDDMQPVGNAIVQLGRGQLAAPVRFLAKAWGWPDKSRVERFLAKLVRLDMARLTVDPATKLTVIALTNYASYQAEAENTRDSKSRRNAGVSGYDRDTPETATETYNRRIYKKESIDHRTDTTSGTLFEIEGDPTAEHHLFEQWWAMVPRKVSKGQARKSFTAALRKAPIERLKDGIARYAQSVADADPKYIKHPSTWLSGECWLDDLPAVEQPAEERDEEAAAAFTREYEAIKRRFGAASVQLRCSFGRDGRLRRQAPGRRPDQRGPPMNAPLNRDRFAKLIALAESDHDGEALAAIRKAAAMARAAGLSLGQAVENGEPKRGRKVAP